MDCFLKVIKGPDTGASCKIEPGICLVGRSSKAALKLTPADISWEHLSITRSGEQCIVENLSASGSYLGDARLTGPIRLRSKDQIRLSRDTVVRYESTGGTDSNNRGMLLLLLLLLCVAAVVVVIVTGNDQSSEWEGTYRQVSTWVNAQSTFGRLPPATPKLFANAWRLEQAGDFADSRLAWMKLKLELDSNTPKLDLPSKNAAHPKALTDMLNPPSQKTGEPTDDEMAAAFTQFINRRLTFATAQMK